MSAGELYRAQVFGGLRALLDERGLEAVLAEMVAWVRERGGPEDAGTLERLEAALHWYKFRYRRDPDKEGVRQC